MGLLNDILSDVGSEMGRLGTQGAAELAAALFSGNDGFVQYGAGQTPIEMERAVEAPQVEAQQIEQPSQGMEM